MKKIFFLLTLLSCLHAFAQVCPDPLATRRKVASSFHSSVMIDYTGVVKYWGDGANPAAPSGNSYILSPQNLSTALYAGTPVAVAAGSVGAGGNTSYDHQLFLLTTQALYGWGASNATITNTTGKTAITTIALPATPVATINLTAANIDFIAASGGGLAIVTKRDGITNGEVYIKNGNGAGSGSVYTYGDGTTGSTFNTAWHRVQTAAGVNLTDVARLSFSQKAIMAQTAGGQVYVWGEQVWAFPGTGTLNTMASRAYATAVLLPDDGGTITPVDINVLSKAYDANAQYATEFILATNGKVYGIGEGYAGILGQGSATDATAWVKVKSPDGSGELSDIVQLSSNNAYVYPDFYYSIGALNSNGQLYLWGDNDSYMLGGTSASYSLPRLPPNFSVNDARVGFFHMGGHTTIAFLRGTNRFCYVGHLIRGSMGDGTSATASRSSYDCINTPDAYICEPPPPLGCAAPSANDLVASSNHATLVINGQPSVSYWGQASSSAEAGVNVPTPRVLYEYNGTPRGVAASAVTEGTAASATQMWILTNEGLWGWGYSARTISSGTPGAVGLTVMALPVPINDVSFIRSSRGGIALVTQTGEIWIKAGSSSACSARVYGDGTTALDNNWHKVKTADAGNPDLTGVTELSFAGNAAMAITPAGVYVWGNNTYLGNGSAMANRSYATLLPALHADFTGTVIPKSVEIIQAGSTGAAQFILGSNGRLYSAGDNVNGVLGHGDLTARSSWTVISSLSSIRKLSSNNPFAVGYSIGAITLNGTVYLWGSNSNGMLGASTSTTQFTSPTIPAGITPGTVAGFEIGGHQTIIFPKTGSQFYFAGHNIGGSKGDNTADGNITSFATGADVVNCAGVVYDISGNLFNDANGVTDGLVNGNGMNSIGSVTYYANLLDEAGYVVGSSAIDPVTGAYSFSGYPSGNYVLQLSETAGTLFSPAPANVTLPAGWNFTGDQAGTTAFAGIDGTPDGVLAISLVSSLSGANIGLDRTPLSQPVTTASAIVAPVGHHTTQVPLLMGSDPEDQPLNGSLSGKIIRITSLPSNGDIYYNGGLLTAGAIISSYDPALLQVDPNDLITQLSFSYQYLDAAGIASNTSVVTMNFRYETISGNVYHDPNGVQDAGGGLVSGSPLSSAGGAALYISLIDPENTGTILATAAVQSNGSYNFSSIVPAGDLKLVLHTVPGNYTSGGSLTAQLPTGWSFAGKQIGTTAGVNINLPVDGNFPVTVVASPFANVNFGIEQTPQADNKIYFIAQPAVNQVITLNGNPAVTPVLPGQLTGSDPEDAPASQGLNGDQSDRRIQIITVPLNGLLKYNGATVTAGDVISQYNKDLLSVALTGAGYTGISFSYVYLDAANIASNTASYSINWGNPLPVTWLSFTATGENSLVKLQWKTATEIDNAGFYIERSLDARAWETIGHTDSKAPNGNSSQVLEYEHTDASPSAGTNYYRLKQVDKNGHAQYSVTRIVQIRKTAIAFSPNPVVSNLRITGCDNGDQLEVVSVDGKVMLTQRATGASTMIDAAGLPAGPYILNVRVAGRLITSLKFVKK